MKQALTAEHRKLLTETILLQPLGKKEQEQMLADFRLRTYRKGELVFHQDDAGQALYVVADGLVRVYHLSQEGEETTVNFFEDGEIFGEFAAIDGKPRLTYVKAVTDLTLLEMPGERIVYHLAQTPGVALAMCKLLVEKVRVTSIYAESLAQNPAKEGLFTELLRYTRKFGTELEKDKRYELDLGLSQEELATLVGKGRNTINPILKAAEKRSLLTFDKGIITILDLPRMEAEANGSYIE